MALDLGLLVLLSNHYNITRKASTATDIATTPVSRPPFPRDARGGTVQMPPSGYEVTLSVWGGAVALRMVVVSTL